MWAWVYITVVNKNVIEQKDCKNQRGKGKGSLFTQMLKSLSMTDVQSQGEPEVRFLLNEKQSNDWEEVRMQQ